MPGPHLTVAELAGELGRSPTWIYEQWPALVANRKMPAPLHDCGALVWNRAQIYAWLDRNLPEPERIAAQAYRAAAAAAAQAHHVTDDVLDMQRARAALDRRFAKSQ